jgi:hypothetical protein
MSSQLVLPTDSQSRLMVQLCITGGFEPGSPTAWGAAGMAILIATARCGILSIIAVARDFRFVQRAPRRSPQCPF